ncbi:DUF1534 domain-containing protein [Pseudomonas syringae pv. maculicola str. ES4326]|uniref:DUF1534 domain-containing protein n=1 Tax=Pseudomonas syringae pv. maculicola str. ES4326 TaxID=629265 RepID=A0A8T8CA52_PSEYM|nr:DUF1534 domain-containing protein [Pseudomonas syringae pv. maculicola str. ES4326]
MKVRYICHQAFPQTGGALRHGSAPRRAIKSGRRASRTACRRGASHDSRELFEIIVPHALRHRSATRIQQAFSLESEER